MICSGDWVSLSEAFEYQRYQTPQVRALLSPPLSVKSTDYPNCVEESWCEQMYAQIKIPLEQLDKAPQPLINWLEQYRS